MKAFSFVLLTAGLTSACGDAGEAPPAREDLTDFVRQGWGEAACPCYLDALMPDNGLVTSPDGNYDHAAAPVCRHAFIPGTNVTMSNALPHVSYAGPMPTPTFLGCNATWAAVQVWKRVQGSATGNPTVGCSRPGNPPVIDTVWELVAESPVVYGTQVGNQCLPAFWLGANLPPLAPGGYKFVAQAGLIFSYQPVTAGVVSL